MSDTKDDSKRLPQATLRAIFEEVVTGLEQTLTGLRAERDRALLARDAMAYERDDVRAQVLARLDEIEATLAARTAERDRARTLSEELLREREALRAALAHDQRDDQIASRIGFLQANLDRAAQAVEDLRRERETLRVALDRACKDRDQALKELGASGLERGVAVAAVQERDLAYEETRRLRDQVLALRADADAQYEETSVALSAQHKAMSVALTEANDALILARKERDAVIAERQRYADERDHARRLFLAVRDRLGQLLGEMRAAPAPADDRGALGSQGAPEADAS